MPLGMELGLGPGDIVLDGASSPKGPACSRVCQLCSFWATVCKTVRPIWVTTK